MGMTEMDKGVRECFRRGLEPGRRTSLCSITTHHTTGTTFQLFKASTHSVGQWSCTTFSNYVFLILHPNKSLLKFLRSLKLNSYTHLILLEKFSKETNNLKRVHKPLGTISFILFMNHISIIFLSHCHLVWINKKY